MRISLTKKATVPTYSRFILRFNVWQPHVKKLSDTLIKITSIANALKSDADKADT